ncbi:DUF5074 domain-containing protein [Solirubrum puertoriconensis]|uniref:Cell surface protein n=1 Tax=Solirubrum puertoriconensis TaxID=1751427 RepID=A0A9X0HIF1_SOLP1|nr:DUF5074 domain-containing protein [Solirubrum puertoriconensis]KUG06434.1 hypothetical protein ASU33_03500 [Solirubrum puertoriconensis]
MQLLMRRQWLPALAVTSLLLGACNPSDDNNEQPAPQVTKAVYVANQGNFGTPTGSVTVYDKPSKQADKDPFQRANGRSAGDVVQSVASIGDRLFIVANNSGKIEIVNAADFRSVGQISNLSQPRYVVAASSSKAYVTEWQGKAPNYTAGRVSVIDLNTYQVTKTIAVGRNPEQPLLAEGKLYVPNSDENTVTVINTATDAVETTLTYTDGPQNLQRDNAGNIWLLCSGITRYGGAPNYPVLSNTPAALHRFTPTAAARPQTFSFTSGGANDLSISPDGTQLYYRYAGAVYRIATSAAALPTTPFVRRRFMAINVDPTEGELYGALGSYTADGKTIRYNTSGAAIDSFNVGLIPGDISFR